MLNSINQNHMNQIITLILLQKKIEKILKKLRTYLHNKKALVQSLLIFYDQNRRSILNRRDYKSTKRIYQNRIKGKTDTTLVNGIYLYTDEYTFDSLEDLIDVKVIREEIIPVLDTLISRKESLLKTNKMIQKNLNIIETDILLCENQIDETLAPTYQKQDFRRNVSTWFTGLIAFLLIGFFTIIYFKSDKSIGKDFLGDNGLQFITLFVLIIAIILFGILGILEGRELAAILSGISGYILGKGINNNGRRRVVDRNNNNQ